MASRGRHGKGLGTWARKLVAEIGTIKSMDITVPVRRGGTVMELTVRTVARTDRPVAELLTRLGLELPRRNRILPACPPPSRAPGRAPPRTRKCSAEKCRSAGPGA